MTTSERRRLPRFAVANRILTVISFAVILVAVMWGASLLAVGGLLAISIILVVVVCSPSRSWWSHDRAAAEAFLADRRWVRREWLWDLALDAAGFVLIGLVFALHYAV